MKFFNAFILVLLCAFVTSHSAFAEFRVWTDANGTKIEADYVRTVIDTVVLRLKNGKEIEVKLDSLSEKDRDYAMVLNPPRIDMKVSMQVNEKTVGYLGDEENTYRLKYEIINPSVTVKKLGPTPYKAKLQLEMTILGEVTETERYIVLERTLSPFTFTTKNKNTFAFESEPIDLKQITGSLEVGIEYYGYIVQVRDSLGRVVAIKSNRDSLEKYAEKIIQYETGSQFNRNLKAVKPRSPSGESGGYTLPGRLF